MVLGGQVILAVLFILGLEAKQQLVASDVEVGTWLRTHMTGEAPLSLYVDHHGGDTNPVSFRYWTRREVHAVVETELNSSQDSYLFIPASLAEWIQSQRGFETIAKYARSTNDVSNFGDALVKIYSKVFPNREKFLSTRSRYEGWILLHRAKRENQ
jgi:hypothetical protein